MKKQFLFLTTAILLFFTTCSGSYVDPGNLETLGGGSGGNGWDDDDDHGGGSGTGGGGNTGGDGGGNTVSVTNVTLNKTTLVMYIGGKETLTATVVPDSATNKNITWSSSNKNVATVSVTNTNCTVTAKSAGTATITVTADGNKTATCEVKVPLIEMVQISGGTFEMGKKLGDSSGSNSTPTHNVTLTAFKMGKTEVTQEQWITVMLSNKSFFAGVGICNINGTIYDLTPESFEVQDKRPVEQVSWYDALVFCNKLSIKEGLTPAYSINGSTDTSAWGTVPASSDSTWDAVEIVSDSNGYRLPTEAQWEYAAKGGDPYTTPGWGGYTYAGSDNIAGVAWYSTNSSQKTHQVGRKSANKLGLSDMSGNVWEWCWDWYGSYESIAQNDPTGASSGTSRVNRGGGWGEEARTTVYRNANQPSYIGGINNGVFRSVGFRVVLPE